MIIVTGTKRSGTSMWMQLLKAAGFPLIGDEFPRDWETTIKPANPAGFWESKLRNGIYFRTNPDPATGRYLFPEQTRGHAVKVFIPGLIRSDRAFIDRVVATVRPWRQYVRSINRLYAMERDAKRAKQAPEEGVPEPSYMDPAIEWWVENFSLFSDIVTRRYPFLMVSYDAIVGEPESEVRRVLDWLGQGDPEAAIARVEPALRTQDTDTDSDLPEQPPFAPEVIEVFDQLYAVVRAQTPLDQPFVDRLNETNQRLQPQIDAAVRETAEAHRARRRALQERRAEAQSG